MHMHILIKINNFASVESGVQMNAKYAQWNGEYIKEVSGKS